MSRVLTRVLTLVLVTILGCADDVIRMPDLPAWAGTYALLADSSSNCQEEQDPSGRRCVCGISGYYEGTLSLTADDTGGVAGTLTVKECRPDGNPVCGMSTSYTVGPFAGPSPPPGIEIPPAWIRFCADGCPYSGNGAWSFGVPSEGTNLVGHYSRADGNVRGCGNDHGPFIAVRK